MRARHERWAALGGVCLVFWQCPIQEHAERNRLGSGEPPVVTVEWREGIAYCTMPGCDRNSKGEKTA